MSSPALGDDPFALATPSAVRAWCQRFGVRPKQRLGQHFLVDRNVLRRLIEAMELRAGEPALEVGAGVGTLTRALAAGGRTVVAVEIDPALRPALAATVEGLGGVRLVFGDALALDLAGLCPEPGPWLVAGNLPYYVTSPLLVRLVEAGPPARRLAVMVQREVADRLTAPAGSPDYGALSVFAQYHAAVRLAFPVPRQAFWPMPQVDSAVVLLDPRPHPAVAAPRDAFFAIVRAAFGQRRKTLRNALAAGLGRDKAEVAAALVAAGVDPERRGETCAIAEFDAIARALALAAERPQKR